MLDRPSIEEPPKFFGVHENIQQEIFTDRFETYTRFIRLSRNNYAKSMSANEIDLALGSLMKDRKVTLCDKKLSYCSPIRHSGGSW